MKKDKKQEQEDMAKELKGYDDGEEDEEEEKKDMTEPVDKTKALVQEAIADMVGKSMEDFGKPILDKLAEVTKVALDYKEAYERLTQDMSVKDAKEAENLRVQLQEEPYGYAADFLEPLQLDQLRSTKETFEASKAYKDFITVQEDMAKPNKELFGKVEMEDFLTPTRNEFWGHLYNKEAK